MQNLPSSRVPYVYHGDYKKTKKKSLVSCSDPSLFVELLKRISRLSQRRIYVSINVTIVKS
ncbi:MAG: hypothetical protein AB2693_23745, partial [Candidatus Thiodiazotropha sp.]